MIDEQTKVRIGLQMETIKAEARSLVGTWMDDPEAVRFIADLNLLPLQKRSHIYRITRLMANANRSPGETVQVELL